MGKEQIERRMHQRFVVPRKGAYVVNSGHLGEILDISRAGLAFRHLNINGLFPESGRLDIVIGSNEFLKDLPVRTVSENVLENSFPTSPLEIRRYSVQFEDLSETQTHLLERFIEEHAEGGRKAAALP